MEKIYFISDNFADNYVGGAEMAIEAVIEQCPCEFEKIESAYLAEEMISTLLKDQLLIIGNFAEITDERILESIAEHCRFVLIEYDFKMSGSRNPTVHYYRTGKPVDKPIEHIKAFFEKAECVFFMSQKQMDWSRNFCTMKRSEVLSSMFTFGEFKKIEEMRKEPKPIRLGNVIQYSISTVKGSKQSVEYARKKGLDYKLLYNISHEQMLREFRNAEAFIFLPFGEDTCPRTVIEAKLLGCRIIVNENVLHHDEKWFDTDNHEETIAYLKGRVPYFWGIFNEIASDMGYSCRGAGRECVRV